MVVPLRGCSARRRVNGVVFAGPENYIERTMAAIAASGIRSLRYLADKCMTSGVADFAALSDQKSRPSKRLVRRGNFA